MNLADAISKWAYRQPLKDALIFGDIRLSYMQLEERVNALSHALIHAGVKRGENVAILAFNEFQFIELFLACSRTGIMLVPLNFRLVGRELEYQIDHSDSKILFLGEEFLETIKKIRPNLSKVKEYVVIGSNPDDSKMKSYETFADLEFKTKLVLDYEVGMEDEFLMIHTSGTTGRPKGAVLTQKNILFTSMNQIIDFGCTTQDITLTSAPLFHAAGCIILTYPLLMIGGTVVLMKHFDAKTAIRLMEKERISVMFAVPAMWSFIRNEPSLKNANLKSLRCALSGGASQPAEEMKIFNETFGVALSEGFGLSECSSCSTYLRPEHSLKKAGSIGREIIFNTVRVVDEKGEIVKPGEVGEIVQNDYTVMKGYYKMPKETKETIIDGWLHTGDLATVDEDGFIYIKGRSKDMIISGGENIYPVELEQVIISHPKISDAAVIGIPDAKWGETVRAIIVPVKGETITEEDVINFCKQNMASYKKPKSVIIIDALPRNPGGKVLKTELRKIYGN